MPVIETQEGHLWHVREEGRGEAILFIHGWAVDSRIWLQQIPHFAQGHRVLALDLPGHGATPWQELNLGEMANDCMEVCEKWGVDSLNIVGSSFGGLLGLKIFDRFPSRVKRLALVGAQPKFQKAQDYPWGLSPERIVKLRSQLETDYPAIVPIFFRSLFTAQERSSERYKWLQGFRQNEDVPERAALLKLLDVLIAADLRPVLSRLHVPFLFLTGTEDPLCPQEIYVDLKRQMPQAGLAWMEGCGHFPFVSQPGKFNQILEKFLEGRDA